MKFSIFLPECRDHIICNHVCPPQHPLNMLKSMPTRIWKNEHPMYISIKGAMPTFSIPKAIVGGTTTTFIKWFREVQNPVVSGWWFRTLGPNMYYYIPRLIYIWFPEDFCCLGQTKFCIWDRVSLHSPGWLRTGLKVRLPAFASPSAGIKVTTTTSRSKGLIKIRQGSGTLIRLKVWSFVGGQCL